MSGAARSALLLTPLVLIAGACGSDADVSAGLISRDTLPDGRVLVRYGPLPAPEHPPLEHDLAIGVVEGPEFEMFGDVRGIEAGPDGEIFILDSQTADIRVFDADGRHLRTIGGRGEGPGEISRANGFIRMPDGSLWIQDHGQWRMLRFAPDGTELERVPMHVLSYGYIWSGTVDDAGRHWKSTNHSDESQPSPPPEGLNEGRSRGYLVSSDPRTEARDSVFLGERRWRSYVRHMDGGYSVRGIPFQASPITVVDPAGGFWTAAGDQYRLVRLGEDGDTALVVEADVPAEPVTAEDRRAFVERSIADVPDETRPGERRVAEEIAGLMPAAKPVMDQMVMDDEGRLWVRRAQPSEGPPLYDLYCRDGEYRGSLRLAFEPARYFPPRIRDGHLYTLTLDDMDVQRVVRVPLPALR